MTSNTRVLRYTVEYWGSDCIVGYHAGLGTVNAREWACQNARTYGGRVLAEYSDGTAEVYRDYGALRTDSPFANLSSEAAKSAA